MSEVKRYLADEQYPGQYSARCDLVPASDYDTALSQLAALREELAKYRQLNDSLMARNLELQTSEQRLADAERRNAELTELLDEHQWQWQPYDDHWHKDSGYYCIECGNAKASGHAPKCTVAVALNKPEEAKS